MKYAAFKGDNKNKMKFQEWFVENIVKNKYLLADTSRWNSLLASFNNGILEGLQRAKTQYEKYEKESRKNNEI